jgi:adenosylcobinamide-GDP ribazoletransferase
MGGLDPDARGADLDHRLPAGPGETHGHGGAAAWLAPIFALQFLTITPPIVRRAPWPASLGSAEAFFPAVGLLLGLILLAADALLRPLIAPPVGDVLLVILLAVMTGALHLDGLIDTFDGVFGGRDPQTRLALMRDPRAGAFGVVAVLCLLLLKIAALGGLPEHARSTALLLAPCLGRWAIVAATAWFPYARPEGLGRAFKDGIRRRHWLLAGTVTASAAAWLAGITGIAVFAASTVVVSVLGAALSRRLGGLTGDTYGALCEVVEASTWVALGSPLLPGTP